MPKLDHQKQSENTLSVKSDTSESPDTCRQKPTAWRLQSWLFASHSVPVVVMAAALFVVLYTLGWVNNALQDLGAKELESLAVESEVHAAAWAVEVAMRQAEDDCSLSNRPELSSRLVGPMKKLDSLLKAQSKNLSEPIRMSSQRYLDIGQQMLQMPDCEQIGTPSAERSRLVVDQTLTEMWTSRLQTLSVAARAKDQHAERISHQVTWVGTCLAMVSLGLGILFARRTARGITEPLRELQVMSQRVGSGEFNISLQPSGPEEIRTLGSDFDHMRRKLAELDGMKQAFLANVSHEMRTPLSKIREALSLLSDGATGPITDQQRRVVTIAMNACEREIRIVTTLLDLSRLRSGSAIQLKSAVSFDDVLESAVDSELADAQKRGVTIQTSSEGNTPITDLDPGLLERAIANLVRNAVSVSVSGKSVQVRKRLISDNSSKTSGVVSHSHVCVEVQDQGPGVPEEIQSTLFEAFVTHSVAQIPDRVGTGLGLSLAKAVAKAHGGDVWLEKSDSKGSLFVLEIPLRHRVN